MCEQMTFAQFAARWLIDYAPVAYKPSTRAEYTACVRNHLLPWFGSLDLCEVSSARVQTYVASVASGELSASSVRNHLTVLRSMFTVAQSWGLVDANPIDGVVGPRAERADINYLSPSEIRQLIEATPAKWRPLIASACLLGLRKGELLALRWSDIDFEKATVRISSTLYRGHLQTAKTSSSVRSVPLAGFVAVQLLSLKDSTRSEGDFVFTQDDKLLDSRVPNRVLSRSLRAAGLKSIRFHDLRHSFVAAHIAAGTPVKVIQALAGHATVKTTMDVYGHLMPALYGQAATAIEDSVFGEAVEHGNHQA